jgi:hypothetical protein
MRVHVARITVIMVFSLSAHDWRECAERKFYPVKKGSGPDPNDIDTLLSRVTLYKVGHHCSHNATLRGMLAKMTDPRLCAMIPVVEETAPTQGSRRWKKPYSPLYEALKRRAKGRVVRGDGDMAEEARIFAGQPEGRGRNPEPVHHPDGLWVEIHLLIGDGSRPRHRPRAPRPDDGRGPRGRGPAASFQATTGRYPCSQGPCATLTSIIMRSSRVRRIQAGRRPASNCSNPCAIRSKSVQPS